MLFARLEALWKTFDQQLRQDTAEHLHYDPVRKTLSWRKPKADQRDTAEPAFCAGLPARDIAGSSDNALRGTSSAWSMSAAASCRRCLRCSRATPRRLPTRTA